MSRKSDPTVFIETTRDVEVRVKPIYLPDQSKPEGRQWVWAYWVTVLNKGAEPVRLRRRYWRITDGTGKVQEVRGPGVVGEEPRLTAGEVFEYTSGTSLPTSSGIMGGSFQMETDGGETFDIAVPTFSLDVPDQKKSVN
ncbi:MAG: Co2+/Mg2+ efflux protein ApaG [Alphaproteobacteria bacterium]|nr:Co2+/Mg2+ efflux protein ApaG [Alphaproteobacteria bacterium]